MNLKKITAMICIGLSWVGSSATMACGDIKYIRSIDELWSPFNISKTSTGDMLVADTGDSTINIYDSAGTLIRVIGQSDPDASNDLRSPRAAVEDMDGNILVADTSNRRLMEFSDDGTFLSKISVRIGNPVALAQGSDGNIWVIAETGGVGVFSRNGLYLSFLNLSGWPYAITASPWGSYFVTHPGGAPIKEYDGSGNSLRAIATYGSGEGQLEPPRAITLDDMGNIWVADSSNYRIVEFNSEGEFIQQFGTMGTGDYQFEDPSGIAFDANGNLWVADQLLNEVKIYSVPEPATLAVLVLGALVGLRRRSACS